MLSASLQLQPAEASDFEALLALRLRAMRDSLERIGRYDEQRARQRLAAGFDPASTWHITVGGRRVGFLVLKRLSHALRIDHLYVDPPEQRRSVGSRVLEDICAEADRLQLPVELVALKGSGANGFYLRHGFVATGDGAYDIDYIRLPQGPSVRAVRALWHAVQQRDWTSARALLRADLQATWWTSGERFTNAEVFIDVQRRYPEGWTVRLLECERLEDGRVLALVRVDHPPHSFFCTSIARVDDGIIFALDEYWATFEPPPAWRTVKAFPGTQRFDVLKDARANLP